LKNNVFSILQKNEKIIKILSKIRNHDNLKALPLTEKTALFVINYIDRQKQESL